ncbi:hypothetical protein DFH07DRAFT_763522 [Mycena maculata]|uniref:Uncharacterized protein n=1 Tax=Mycena maculata TaxID=230809 RepID=A0AAD7KHK9_9AGAR|nr:hypothetical protein DFH07DRAFT_763522 [Mycena maculata]
MATPTIPDDVCWYIGVQGGLSVRVALMRLNSSIHELICPLIYRHIHISRRRAYGLIHSLLCNVNLPPMVKSLVFDEGEFRPHLDETEWLKFFGARTTIMRPWTGLLAVEPDLEELALNSQLFITPPELPQLRAIKARAADVAHFLECKDLIVDVWLAPQPLFPGESGLTSADLRRFSVSPSRLKNVRLGASQFLDIFKVAPDLLTSVHYIILDECNEWHHFCFGEQLPAGIVLETAALLNERFLNLETLMLVSESAPRTPGGASPTKVCNSRSDSVPVPDVAPALVFSRVLSPLCRAPRLRTYHFCAFNHCVTFNNWGQVDEEVDVHEWEDHVAGALA